MKNLLPLIACALLLASCNAAPQSTVQGASFSQNAQYVNLSSDGRQALYALRAAAGRHLTENEYLNTVIVTPFTVQPDAAPSNASLQEASSWARDRFSSFNPPVKVNWMTAYTASSALNVDDLIDACLKDQGKDSSCKVALSKATHATVERDSRNATWLLVLADLQGSMTVKPGVR